MNIVFDLDGTLIDASERMYHLFQKLVPQSTLTKKEYWERKRNKVNHQQLLSNEFPKVNYDKFNREWLIQIEKPPFLEMDCCYKDTIFVLKELKKTNALYLLTARQSKANLLKELEYLKILEYFNEIFVTEGKNSKKELFQTEMSMYPEKYTCDDWFISDMGKDIQVGKEMNFFTIAISHGFMSRERLVEYKPDICVDELTELLLLHKHSIK